jgi:hypothetical protein
MIIDIDKLPLVVLPSNHLIFKEKKEVMEIANTNRALKKTIFIGITIGVITLIYLNTRNNERREKKD